MAAPVFVHGKLGTISLNGTLFNMLSIDYEEAVTNEDITYSQAGGATYQVMIPGYKRATVSMQFVYDTANQPTIAPFNLTAGQSVTVIAYPEGTKPFGFTAIGNSLKFTTGPQAGAVKCTWGGDSTSAITDPSS